MCASVTDLPVTRIVNFLWSSKVRHCVEREFFSFR